MLGITKWKEFKEKVKYDNKIVIKSKILININKKYNIKNID